MFANDELKKTQPGKLYILNLQNHNQPGSHWTLLGPGGWYFDPFGVVPTKEIAPLVTQYNPYDFQGYSKDSCGYFCMYVADNIFAGRPPAQGLVPNAYEANERVLKSYFE